MFKTISSLVFGLAIIGSASASAIDQSHLRGLIADRALKKCYQCDTYNPCTDGGHQYFKHCDYDMYIQCAGAVCYEMDCAPGTRWDQKKLTCVHDGKKSPDSPDDLDRCGSCKENPCTKKALADGMYYHKHCKKSKKYLQCGSEAGMCYERDCAPGTRWDQKKLTCVHQKKKSSPDGSGNLSWCGTCKENPCTKKALSNGMYYHKHCKTSKKYLQCGSEVGMCYERKCAPGTRWNQKKLTCVHEKKSSPDGSGNLGRCGSCKKNPCTKKALADGIYYHEHCHRNKKYLQCGSDVGMCYERDCAPGTVWKQKEQACVEKKN